LRWLRRAESIAAFARKKPRGELWDAKVALFLPVVTADVVTGLVVAVLVLSTQIHRRRNMSINVRVVSNEMST